MALYRRVFRLDCGHCLVDELADRGLGRIGLKMRPSRFLRHPEDVFTGVFVAIFGREWIFPQKGFVAGFEGERDIRRKISPRTTCL